MPFTQEYLELFEYKVSQNLNYFDGIKIVLHKAFYVESMQKDNENIFLQKIYNVIVKNFKSIIVIEPEYRIANDKHKHGLAPYHYIDSYYLSFLKTLELKLNEKINLKLNFSMNK